MPFLPISKQEMLVTREIWAQRKLINNDRIDENEGIAESE